MGKPSPAVAVVGDDVPAAANDPLVAHESLESDGTAGVDTRGANAHLGTEAVPESVGKARTRVPT